MNLLLDTHVFLWFWWDDPKLSDKAKELIVDPDNRKLVSVASCWEVAIKVSLNKLDLGLPFHHRDPFDRTLVAQAQWDEMPIVSADQQLDSYEVERLW